MLPQQRNSRRRMTTWSAENATKAYLRPLKMGKRGKEPDVAEFISALAAGNNAQLMVMACAGTAGSTALALVAAAHQTGGRLVCIFRNLKDFHASEKFLGHHEDIVEFVVGDARKILLNDYKGADFVLIDFNIEDHEGIFLAAQRGASNGGALVVGYNALHKGPWLREVKGHFLPIGEGLVVARTPAGGGGDGGGKKSHWIVRVDECTGEEHFYRFTFSCRKQIGT